MATCARAGRFNLGVQVKFEITEPHFGRTAGVDLKGDDSAGQAGGVVEVHAGVADYDGADEPVHGNDAVFVC